MAILESLTFKDWNSIAREVRFISSAVQPSDRNFELSIITGENGSNKSTLLRELVSALTIPGNTSSIQFRRKTNDPTHVICTSGSVADRFPSKEMTGGRSSEFDVPNYSYLGQRVGPNLLSKKRPLETLLTFALADERAHRFQWKFFEKAHRFAGIKPHVEYEILPKRGNSKNPIPDILGGIQTIAVRGGTGNQSLKLKKPVQSLLSNISPTMAEWLLEEFHYDEFNEIQRLLSGKSKKVRLLVGGSGARSDAISNAALRLGFVMDLLSLTDAKVRSRGNSSEFSLFDLSSGEYHMYSSILGLGFGLSESSVVLIDEPENSLHPQWQLDFMESVYDICSQTLTSGHLIICTHSPLIVGTALKGSTIIDLTGDAPVVNAISFGASSDELLLSQFGLSSGRNRLVVDTIQRAVSYVERGEFDHPQFIAMGRELSDIRQALRPDDPLIEIIDALLEEDRTP